VPWLNPSGLPHGASSLLSATLPTSQARKGYNTATKWVLRPPGVPEISDRLHRQPLATVLLGCDASPPISRLLPDPPHDSNLMHNILTCWRTKLSWSCPNEPLAHRFRPTEKSTMPHQRNLDASSTWARPSWCEQPVMSVFAREIPWPAKSQ
jgi:hypothetical protein